MVVTTNGTVECLPTAPPGINVTFKVALNVCENVKRGEM